MSAQFLNLPEAWFSLITDLLTEHPQGLSELALIDALSQRAPDTLSRDELAHPASRFRVHFMLFHTLYRLRAQWLRDHQAQLSIDPLCIIRQPYIGGDSHALDQHDPLADYYLNGDHLHHTDLEALMTMIGDFWRQLSDPQDRQQALADLALPKEASPSEIKQQYRRLCMRHHPDRGGNKAAYQKIQTAYQRLKGTATA